MLKLQTRILNLESKILSETFVRIFEIILMTTICLYLLLYSLFDRDSLNTEMSVDTQEKKLLIMRVEVFQNY